MNTIFIFKRFVASIVMILTVTLVMNAQSTDLPWHVVVYENDGEAASHSIEIISDMEVNSEEVTFVLSNGDTYSYPITSTFVFEQRAGNGTAIETVAAPQWNVYYANGNLHFTESVNNVAVYSVSGILVNKFSGKATDVQVNLANGVYILQADGKSVKLSVTNHGNGSTSARPTIIETTPKATYTPASPISLRGAAGADYKQYWNITAGGSTMPIMISDVSSFYFTSNNTIMFTMNNGNTVELTDYNGVTFTAQPVQTGSDWDLQRTFAIGGGSYGYDGGLGYPMEYKVEFISAISRTEIIIYDVLAKKETGYPSSSISAEFLNKAGAVLSVATQDDYWGGKQPSLSYFKDDLYTRRIYFEACFPIFQFGVYERGYVGIPVGNYDFNGGTNRISTTFEIDKGGNLVTTYINADGVTRQYTFRNGK